MGKQSRRKHRNRKKDKQDDTNSSEKTSALIKRLRHGDAKVRHGALAALCATLLDPDTLQRNSKRTISTLVLQTVRERIMDNDLECSQAAAGCLANYVSFSLDESKNEVTAGWTLVLLSRLEQCHAELAKRNNETTNFNEKQRSSTNPHSRQWWAVTVQCLHALCALVEINPQALERIMNHKSIEFIRLLLGLLALGCKELQAASTVHHEEDEVVDWIQHVTTYSVRTLHSALDDNVDLLMDWIQQSGNEALEGFDLLHSCCTPTLLLSEATHLHAAGCLVTIRQLLLMRDNGDLAEKIQTEMITPSVCPLLSKYLDYNSDRASQLVQTLVSTTEEYLKEQEDDALEKEVIQNVNTRKEPARLIARRQKQLKQQQQEKEQQAQKTMEEDHDDAMQDDDEKQEEQQHERSDCRDNMEKARQAWNSAVLPLHLAFEISANITGSFAKEAEQFNMDEDHDAMDEDEDWGPAQEAQLLAQQSSSPNGETMMVTTVPLDKLLMDSLIETGLPDRLVVLLKGLCTPLLPGSGDDMTVPAQVSQDLDDLVSKSGACIGNCLGNLASWRASEPIAVWKELVHAMQVLVSPTPPFTEKSGIDGISSAMVVGLRSRELLRSQMQQGDLDVLMSWLQQTSQPPLQRDAACMLGILCSTETHSAAVNTKVCASLLALTSSSHKNPPSAMIQSEVFNALMDMYGDDERHANVFASLQVLDHFHRTLPIFKKRIHSERNSVTLEESEQWKETALNASRFIEYKKNNS